jgi:hypothetical protein
MIYFTLDVEYDSIYSGVVFRLIELSVKQKRKKYLETDKEGFIRVYPSLHETKERGRLQLLIRLLKRLKKGH